MTTLATPFRTILSGLQVTLGLLAGRNHVFCDLICRVWHRLTRTITRFERLVTRWQAGTLPKPRTRPRPLAPRTRRPAQTFPTGNAWLIRRVQHHNVNAAASQLRYFLDNTPDLAAFLAAAPQANRLLRPLCQMLGLTPPVPLPPRPPAAPRSHPRPPRPPKPRVSAAPPSPPAPTEPSLAQSPLGLRFLPL